MAGLDLPPGAVPIEDDLPPGAVPIQDDLPPGATLIGDKTESAGSLRARARAETHVELGAKARELTGFPSFKEAREAGEKAKAKTLADMEESVLGGFTGDHYKDLYKKFPDFRAMGYLDRKEKYGNDPKFKTFVKNLYMEKALEAPSQVAIGAATGLQTAAAPFIASYQYIGQVLRGKPLEGLSIAAKSTIEGILNTAGQRQNKWVHVDPSKLADVGKDTMKVLVDTYGLPPEAAATIAGIMEGTAQVIGPPEAAQFAKAAAGRLIGAKGIQEAFERGLIQGTKEFVEEMGPTVTQRKLSAFKAGEGGETLPGILKLQEAEKGPVAPQMPERDTVPGQQTFRSETGEFGLPRRARMTPEEEAKAVKVLQEREAQARTAVSDSPSPWTNYYETKLVGEGGQKGVTVKALRDPKTGETRYVFDLDPEAKATQAEVEALLASQEAKIEAVKADLAAKAPDGMKYYETKLVGEKGQRGLVLKAFKDEAGEWRYSMDLSPEMKLTREQEILWEARKAQEAALEAEARVSVAPDDPVAAEYRKEFPDATPDEVEAYVRANAPEKPAFTPPDPLEELDIVTKAEKGHAEKIKAAQEALEDLNKRRADGKVSAADFHLEQDLLNQQIARRTERLRVSGQDRAIKSATVRLKEEWENSPKGVAYDAIWKSGIRQSGAVDPAAWAERGLSSKLLKKTGGMDPEMIAAAMNRGIEGSDVYVAIREALAGKKPTPENVYEALLELSRKPTNAEFRAQAEAFLGLDAPGARATERAAGEAVIEDVLPGTPEARAVAASRPAGEGKGIPLKLPERLPMDKAGEISRAEAAGNSRPTEQLAREAAEHVRKGTWTQEMVDAGHIPPEIPGDVQPLVMELMMEQQDARLGQAGLNLAHADEALAAAKASGDAKAIAEAQGIADKAQAAMKAEFEMNAKLQILTDEMGRVRGQDLNAMKVTSGGGAGLSPEAKVVMNKALEDALNVLQPGRKLFLNPFDPEIWRAWGTVSAHLIRKGATSFGAWSVRMGELVGEAFTKLKDAVKKQMFDSAASKVARTRPVTSDQSVAIAEQAILADANQGFVPGDLVTDTLKARAVSRMAKRQAQGVHVYMGPDGPRLVPAQLRDARMIAGNLKRAGVRSGNYSEAQWTADILKEAGHGVLPFIDEIKAGVRLGTMFKTARDRTILRTLAEEGLKYNDPASLSRVAKEFAKYASDPEALSRAIYYNSRESLGEWLMKGSVIGKLASASVNLANVSSNVIFMPALRFTHYAARGGVGTAGRMLGMDAHGRIGEGMVYLLERWKSPAKFVYAAGKGAVRNGFKLQAWADTHAAFLRELDRVASGRTPDRLSSLVQDVIGEEDKLGRVIQKSSFLLPYPGDKGVIPWVRRQAARIEAAPLLALDKPDTWAKIAGERAHLRAEGFRLAMDANPNLKFGDAWKASEEHMLAELAKDESRRSAKAMGESIIDALQEPFEQGYKNVPGTIFTIGKSVQKIPVLGKASLPFVRTGLNATRQVWRYSPTELINPRFWSQLKAGGLSREDAMARVLVGSAIAGGAVAMTYAGLIHGDGPSDRKARERLKRTGWQPRTITIGGEQVPLNVAFGDVAGRLAVMWANLAEKGAEAGRDFQGMNKEQAAQSIFLPMTPQAFDSAAKTFGNLLSGEERAGTAMAGVALGFVPSGLKQFAAIQDSYERKPDSFMEAIQATIPGQREKLPMLLTPLGAPVLRKKWATVFGAKQVYSEDELDKAMASMGVDMPDVGEYVKVSQDEREDISPADRNRILKEREAIVRPMLAALIPAMKERGVEREMSQWFIERVLDRGYPENSRAVMLVRGKYAAKHVGVDLDDAQALSFGEKLSDGDFRTLWNVKEKDAKLEILRRVFTEKAKSLPSDATGR